MPDAPPPGPEPDEEGAAETPGLCEHLAAELGALASMLPSADDAAGRYPDVPPEEQVQDPPA